VFSPEEANTLTKCDSISEKATFSERWGMASNGNKKANTKIASLRTWAKNASGWV
jgi:hypothetical protein